MSNTTVNAAAILTPEQVQSLVVEPVTRQSIATQASTPVFITSKDTRFPILKSDPDAGWVAEGAEIDVDDAEFDELEVIPKKVAAITVISSELATDSTPEAQEVIGSALVRSLVSKIDSAYFGNTITNGPSGLGSLTDRQLVLAGVTPSNTDAFLEAQSLAENVGANISAWVTDPTTALTLAKLKKQTGSNEPLLSTDAASPTGKVIAGVPVYTSPYVPTTPARRVWGIAKSKSFVVIRKDTTVDIDKSAFWTSDRVGVRAIARVAFAFPHQEALVEVRLASPGS